MTNEGTRQEKFFLCNSLAVLLKAVEGERTSVDLRNEASIYGTVEQADGYMNIVMRDCVFTDPRGDKFSYEIFFVHARNIRFVHIPPNIPIIPAIKKTLQNMTGSQREQGPPMERTLRTKRTMQTQLEGLAAVDRILKDRKEKENPDVAGE